MLPDCVWHMDVHSADIQVNCGHAEAPGHSSSPGVQHSPTTEIASQQIKKYVLHPGSPPAFQPIVLLGLLGL